jgi:hypothetical protein
MPFKRLLLIPLVTVSCSTMPKPPEGEICNLDTKADKSVCVQFFAKDIPSPSKDLMRIVPLVQMNGFICFPPSTWENIEYFNRALSSKARQCQ